MNLSLGALIKKKTFEGKLLISLNTTFFFFGEYDFIL